MRFYVLLMTLVAAAPVWAQQPYGYAPPQQQYAPAPMQQQYAPAPMQQQYAQPQQSAPQQPQQAYSPPQFNVWSLLNQARAQIQQGNAQKALEYSQQFTNMRPLEPEGYFWQGVSYDNMLQTGQAVQAYEAGVQRVLRAGMDSAELRMNLGNDLLKVNRADDAIAQYRRATQIDPQLPLAHLNLGRALLEKGEVEGALECFQRCEDLHFKPSQLAYYRAKAMIKAGRLPEAKAQLQTAIATFGETSPVSQKLKQEFASLLGTAQPTATTSGGTDF